MMNTINIMKFNMIIIWIFLASTQFIPAFSAIAEGSLWALMIMPLIHAIEFFIYLPILKKAPGSMARHFIQVVLYTLKHLITVF